MRDDYEILRQAIVDLQKRVTVLARLVASRAASAPGSHDGHDLPPDVGGQT